MDNMNTVLVALMFVTILTMGIGNVLTTLAAIVHAGQTEGRDRLHISWIALLLVAHLNLFWHAVDIIAIENWKFSSFLLIITGPVIMFFATNIMLAKGSSGDGIDPPSRYLNISKRFFTLFVLLQFWSIFVELIFGDGIVVTLLFEVAFITLALILLVSQSYRVHATGAAVAWVIYLTMFTLRSTEIIV